MKVEKVLMITKVLSKVLLLLEFNPNNW